MPRRSATMSMSAVARGSPSIELATEPTTTHGTPSVSSLAPMSWTASRSTTKLQTVNARIPAERLDHQLAIVAPGRDAELHLAVRRVRVSTAEICSHELVQRPADPEHLLEFLLGRELAPELDHEALHLGWRVRSWTRRSH